MSVDLKTLDELERLSNEAYEITSCGKVYSIASNWRGFGRRELKQHPNSHGYPSVRLTLGGKRKHIVVHRLVMLKHGPVRPSSTHEICHIDGNKNNNVISNLRWGTRKDNAADRTKHGNCRAAENGRKSAYKLTRGYKARTCLKELGLE